LHLEVQQSALRDRLAETARQEYEAKYTWEARAEKVLAGLSPGESNQVHG